MKQSTNEYVDNHLSFFNTLSNPNEILNSEANRLVMFYEKKSIGETESTAEEADFLLNTIENFSANISVAQKELLLEINNIFNNESNPNEIISKLIEIKNVQCLELPVEERYVIYAATTIGTQSVEYWHENLDEWISTITNNKCSKEFYAAKGWFNWGSVGKNDVAGAIGGAIVGAATGGVGAGPVAAAGFVGGGIGTSATDAVLQVLNHYL